MPDLFETELVERCLELLGKRKLVLAIHDGSFPGDDGEDFGRGTPYSRAGRRFVAFVRRLGFNGLQLGPQGLTSRGNPSPYDGTAFSRNTLSIAPAPLARDPQWGGLLSEEALADELLRVPAGERERVQYTAAWEAQGRLMERAFQRFQDTRGPMGAAVALAGELTVFADRHRRWLEPDSLYEALVHEHGSEDWRQWPAKEGQVDSRLYCPLPGQALHCRRRREEVRKRYLRRLDFYVFCQFIAHRQHQELHAAARNLGLDLFADFQIGLSLRDTWGLQALFLPGYALGAPPSRTNRSGQPWGYPVFFPGRTVAGRTAAAVGTGGGPLGGAGIAPGPVVAFLRWRAAKLFEEYDGLRIDHPQGLVCPWVYRTDDPDPLRAVQTGARLFESAGLPDHPLLEDFAIPRRDQLTGDPGVPRYADNWVRSLEPEQVERYAALVAVIVQAARGRGLAQRNIACEILSTLPYPLERVIGLYNLGRFRVTQKADLQNPQDVYRSEQAEPPDWIMMGTHDTPPIWRVAERWFREGQARERAAYLARRLAPAELVETYRAEFARDSGRLVHAQLADALASRAEQVLVFFSDLFGLREVYNTPGTVGLQNWSLRVPQDYPTSYPERASRLRALNLPYAMALALGSPGRRLAAAQAGLIARLRAAAGEARRR